MHDLLRLAVYAAPPVALDNFHSFDPESFVVGSMLADSLVYIDEHGRLVPWLATAWERESPVSLVMDLRRGVRFHDGTPFTSRDVVATFAEHHRPGDPTINGKGVLAPIKSVEPIGRYRVRIETHFPDAMLLYRLFFGSIFPARVLEKYGREAVLDHPIGTGPYELVEWNQREHILLHRNEHHFMGAPEVEYLQLPILPQTEWVEALGRGELDIALNLDAHDAVRAREAGLVVQHAAATMSHFFLLANRGPLADARVRRALNHAIHRDLLVEVAEHGHGLPAASLLAGNQVGVDPSLAHHRYSIDRAKQLLAEAGYADGFTLRGLVSNTSSVLFQMTREFLARVGVRLEAEIVPRTEWLRRVVSGRMMGEAFDGDFAVSNVDNPVCHGLFHHYIFLFSHGPFSLTRSEDYDARFLAAATNLDPEAGLQALQELDRYAQDEALALFTVSPHVYTAARPGVSVPMPASGHFNSAVLRRLHKDPGVSPSTGYTHVWPDHDDLAKLHDATSHPSIFFGPDRATYGDIAHQRLWDRLLVAQDRRAAQDAPMLRELVSSAESKLHLSNVLGSTTRVGIVGYSDTGRQLFVNEGYRSMVDPDGGTLEDLHVAGEGIRSWADIRETVDAEGTWSGAVALERPRESRAAHLHLTASQATDRHGVALGYTYVFSDFSGAEERVRSQALQRIMDHVPYGLFTVLPDLTIAPGYSRACSALFGTADLQGTPLPKLLRMDTRAAEDLEALVEQVFADVLPEDVALDQLPSRIVLSDRVLSLTASVIRDDADDIEGVLFSALDVTALEVARRDLEETQAAIAVLEDRDRFASIARGYLATLERLAIDIEHPETPAEARRELHTFKGEFGMFGQRDVVAAIHAAEERTPLTAADLLKLRDAFAERLEVNAHIWRIRRDGSDTVRIESGMLESLADDMAACDDVETLRARVLAFAAHAMGKPASVMAGPLSETCQRLAIRLGKRVNFRFEGADLRVPEAHGPIYRTLPHLLRNAIDHGIEPADARGTKSVVGTIALRVQETDDGFELCFSDDGRGIDVEAVARKAVESGAYTSAEVDAMDDAERLQLIFLPGLSTAREATDLSGRGIGMHAVRTVVERIGGTVTLRSEPGAGTTLTMSLPPAGATTLRRHAAANAA